MNYSGPIRADVDDPRARVIRGVHAASLSSTSSITLSRVLWACALPGTVAVIAALTLPDMLADGGEAAAPARASQSARAAATGAAPQTATEPLLASLPVTGPH